MALSPKSNGKKGAATSLSTCTNQKYCSVMENKLTHWEERRYRKVQEKASAFWDHHTYGETSDLPLLNAYSKLVMFLNNL